MDQSTLSTTTELAPKRADKPLPLRSDDEASGSQDDAASFIEINIPLPPLPNSPVTATPAIPTSPTSPRSPLRMPFSTFGRKRSSTNPPSADPPASSRPLDPTARYDKRIELSMGAASKGRRKRTSTIDAAIVPAIMVLRAELFTPGQGGREKKALDAKDRLEIIPDK